jgi:hypothetical protein
MDVSALRLTLAEDRPPASLTPPLAALWWDAKGDWAKAHGCVDSEDGADAAWAHAYLHRKEGDLGNAGYWYRRAGRPMPSVSLEQEWAEVVAGLPDETA